MTERDSISLETQEEKYTLGLNILDNHIKTLIEEGLLPKDFSKENFSTTGESFGKLLRRYRARAGVSTRVLSNKAGISNSELYRIENGIFSPTLETAIALSHTLQVPLCSLIGEMHTKESK